MATGDEPAGDARARDLVRRPALVAGILEDLDGGTDVLLRGAAGVGKSVVLGMVDQAAADRGLTTLRLTGSELGASVPFGAFFAILGADAHIGPEPDSSVRLAARAVDLATGIDLLIVDDIHSLDAASAGLVHRIAAGGVRTLVAARTGEDLPAAIESLWVTGRLHTSDVAPFTETETAQYIRTLLAAPTGPDAGLVHAIHRRSLGNALFIRELVGAGIERGTIVEIRGVWVLRGRLTVDGTLADMLHAQLARAPEGVRTAVEIVALMDSLRSEWALDIVPAAALEQAEAMGFLHSEHGEGVMIRLDHPLWRDVASGSLSPIRRLRLTEALTAAVEGADLTVAERIAIGRLQLEADSARPASAWLALSELVSATDPALAEQALVIAIRQGAGLAAQLALANLLTHQHRVEESEALFDDIAQQPLDDEQRIFIAGARGYLLAMPAQRPELAIALLDDTIARYGPRPALMVTRATALWRNGCIDEAIALAKSAIEDAAAQPVDVAHGLLTWGSAMIYRADASGIGGILDRLTAAAGSVAGALPEGVSAARVIGESRAAVIFGDPREAAATMGRGYLDALQRGEDGVRAQYALMRGWALALAGRLGAGLTALREAYAGQGVWTPTTLPWLRSTLIEVLVAMGRVDEARPMLAALGIEPAARLYRLDIVRARAAVLVADGQAAAACALLAEESVEPERQGSILRVSDCWLARLRYGDTGAAPGVIARFRHYRTPYAGAVIELAKAVQSAEGAAFEGATEALADAGLLWFAAEAQARAVDAYRRDHEVTRLSLAAERLRRLRDACPGLDSVLVRAADGSHLTPRESQLALLAGRGLHDAQIAAELGISIRTVQTHLTRVYAKLGVRSRTELAARTPAAYSED